MRKILINIGLILLGIILGILGSILFMIFLKNKTIIWSKEVTSGDLVNLLIAITISWYIPWIIHKNNNKFSNVQNHIISELNSIETFINSIEQLVEDHIKERYDIQTTKSRIHTRLKHIGTKIKQLEEFDKKYLNKINTVRDQGYKLRDEITKNFGDKDFDIDNNYLQIINITCDDLMTAVIICKKDFLSKYY